MMNRFFKLIFAIFLFGSAFAFAQDQEQSDLEPTTESIKQAMLALNRDLFILEEELLFPGNTQLAVFVSMDVGQFFQLDAVKLTLDEKPVTHYLYSERQTDALKRGGVQRLYLGNIKAGDHEWVAVYTGRGPDGRDYRRAVSLNFEKSTGIKQLELKIVDDESMQQPEFRIVEW